MRSINSFLILQLHIYVCTYLLQYPRQDVQKLKIECLIAAFWESPDELIALWDYPFLFGFKGQLGISIFTCTKSKNG